MQAKYPYTYNNKKQKFRLGVDVASAELRSSGPSQTSLE